MLTNLLTETSDFLNLSGKSPADVLWIGSNDGKHAISWDDFMAIANFDYDAGYGGNVVHSDLVVVGVDWWLERGEYDGSEWWEFKTLPQLREGAAKFGEIYKRVYGPDEIFGLRPR